MAVHYFASNKPRPHDHVPVFGAIGKTGQFKRAVSKSAGTYEQRQRGSLEHRLTVPLASR